MHYGIIAAVCVKVETVNCFVVGVFYAVAGNKAANYGVIVARLQIVQPRFYVIIVSAVAEWI